VALVAESDLTRDFGDLEFALNQEFLAPLQALRVDKLHRTYARADSKQSREVEPREAGQKGEVTRGDWFSEVLGNIDLHPE
jgi:hypothetical protein